MLEKCIEIPPLGLFKWDLSKNSLSLYRWNEKYDETFAEQLTEVQSILGHKIEVSTPIAPFWLTLNYSNQWKFNFEELISSDNSDNIFEKLLSNETVEGCCNELIFKLKRSMVSRLTATPSKCRICLEKDDVSCSHAKVGILFSGGIDCTILACVANDIIDQNLPIDLINVSFEKISRSNAKQEEVAIDYSTPDRVSAKQSLVELQRLRPNRKWNLIEVNVKRNELNEMMRTRICHLVNPLNSVLDESLGAVLWFAANICNSMQSFCRVNYAQTCYKTV